MMSDDPRIRADPLIEELASTAASKGRAVEKLHSARGTHRRPQLRRDLELEAYGARRAYCEAISALQTDSALPVSFRRSDGTVDVDGFLSWCEQHRQEARERALDTEAFRAQANEYVLAWDEIRDILVDQDVIRPALADRSAPPAESGGETDVSS